MPKATDEQRACLDAFLTGDSLVIEAGAGSGKTSVLRMLANNSPGRKGLYLAFNRSIADEAQSKFPSSVRCMTAHALARRAVGRPYAKRIGVNGMKLGDAAKRFGHHGPIAVPNGSLSAYSVMRLAMDAVNRFVKSVDPVLSKLHVRLPGEVDFGLSAIQRAQLTTLVFELAEKAWGDICDPAGVLTFEHDHYLKMFSLTKPTLPFDYILFDEAQDADENVASIVKSQSQSQLVAVGDTNQAIYQWNGSVDFLAEFGRLATHRMRLTQSFRFGPRIADEANTWLRALDSDFRISGTPAMASTVGPVGSPAAVLCRTNAGSVSALIDAQRAGRKAAIVGGGKEILAFAEGAQKLIEQGWSPHPQLSVFKSWESVQTYVKEDPQGEDLATMVNLVDRFGAKSVIGAIRKAVPEEDAEVSVSTAHKAKGREWDTVRVHDDFPEPSEDKQGRQKPVRAEDAMLAYVTVTRAQSRLDNDGLAWVHSYLARRQIAA